MKRLTNIDLSEISLVDDPANEHAKVTLWKRNSPDNPDNSAGAPGVQISSKEVHMDPKELEKKLGELETQNAELTKQVEKAQNEAKSAQSVADTIEKAAKENGLEINKADDGTVTVSKKDDEYVDFNGTKIAKSQCPKEVLDAIEKGNKEIAELKKAQEAETLAKRAREELPNLGGKPEAKGELLKFIDGLESGQKDELMKSLKAADHAVSKMFKEIGKTGNDDENSAEGRLNKMVSEFQKSSGKTYEQAYAEVTKTKEGAQLLAQAEEDE